MDAGADRAAPGGDVSADLTRQGLLSRHGGSAPRRFASGLLAQEMSKIRLQAAAGIALDRLACCLLPVEWQER
jgi:hypothetical protein